MRLFQAITSMTPFTPAERNPIEDMIKRQALLSQPCDYFRSHFGGRVPTLVEKLAWIEQAMQNAQPGEIWENDIYTVRVRRRAPFVHLDISRKDELPCENWHHFQQIKNELVGPEHEAVELYPAESRLVDTANQYHLWIVADPNYRFPFGFKNRMVFTEPIQVQTDDTGAVRTTDTRIVPLDSVSQRQSAAV